MATGLVTTVLVSRLVNHLRTLEGCSATRDELLPVLWRNARQQPLWARKQIDYVVMVARSLGFPIHNRPGFGWYFAPQEKDPLLPAGPGDMRPTQGAAEGLKRRQAEDYSAASLSSTPAAANT